VELVDLRAGQAAAAYEHLAERFVRPRLGRCRRYDSPAIEAQLYLSAIGVREFEDAGLALLTDELEDVGDSEILEIATQCHRHRQAFLRVENEASTMIM
jgi:hypothetical protein